jgi:hypothetical protein
MYGGGYGGMGGMYGGMMGGMGSRRAIRLPPCEGGEACGCELLGGSRKRSSCEFCNGCSYPSHESENAQD